MIYECKIINFRRVFKMAREEIQKVAELVEKGKGKLVGAAVQ